MRSLNIWGILRSLRQNRLLVDVAIAGTIVLIIYSLAITFDLNEKWIEWAEQYEQWELDELPLGLSILAFAMVWFAWRRIQDLKKINHALSQTKQSLLSEITQREQAEKQEAEIRQKIEQNINTQQARNAKDAVIQDMGELLMFAQNKAEIINITVQRAKKVVPFESGAIYEYQGNNLRHLQGWGELTQDIPRNTENYSCWAGRRCQPHIETCPVDDPPLCARAILGYQTVCVPILTPKGIWGIFHFRRRTPTLPEEQELNIGIQEIKRLTKAITDALGLHLHNLFLKEQLTTESIKDPLTGILNRRGLKQALRRQGLFQKPEVNCAVLIFDIDHFKAFNDRYGHDMGDYALLSVVNVVNKVIRAQDIFCRYGGEEFVLILPQIDLKIAVQRAEKIRTVIEHKLIKISQKQFESLTVSIGIAIYPDHGTNCEILLKHADEALYFAKKKGRNQVIEY